MRPRPAQAVEPALPALGVDAPAGLDRDVLHAIDRVRRRHTGDAGVGSDLPQPFAGPGVEGPEVPIIGAHEEVSVTSVLDLPHATCAEGGPDFAGAERGAELEGHGWKSTDYNALRRSLPIY